MNSKNSYQLDNINLTTETSSDILSTTNQTTSTKNTTNKNIKKVTYKQIKLLGQGNYGKAYLVQCISEDPLYKNKHAVIKSMNLECMSKEAKEEAYKEAKILEKLDHPNIIRFIEVFSIQ